MIEAIQNIFNIPDLRKRIAFMLALLAVYRIGAHIPTPGIDSDALANFFSQNSNTLFGFLDLRRIESAARKSGDAERAVDARSRSLHRSARGGADAVSPPNPRGVGAREADSSVSRPKRRRGQD